MSNDETLEFLAKVIIFWAVPAIGYLLWFGLRRSV